VEVRARARVRAERHSRDVEQAVGPPGRDVLRRAELSPVVGEALDEEHGALGYTQGIPGCGLLDLAHRLPDPLDRRCDFHPNA
jgi:hypothetical protein